MKLQGSTLLCCNHAEQAESEPCGLGTRRHQGEGLGGKSWWFDVFTITMRHAACEICM
jgi:hypothetical protein